MIQKFRRILEGSFSFAISGDSIHKSLETNGEKRFRRNPAKIKGTGVKEKGSLLEIQSQRKVSIEESRLGEAKY